MSKRSRNRQLARLAAQRQMDRRRRERRRQTATIAVALVIALAGGTVAFLAFTGGDGSDVASASGPTATGPTASGPTGPTTTGPSGASGETAPGGKPGTRTGTVRPTPGPASVACDGAEPANATDPKPQFNEPRQVVETGSSYTATMRTSCGDIVIELLADAAPETVNSFVFLAEEGYFDGTRFHRIDTSIDVIQGGDPTGTGTGGPGYSIPDELTGEESYGPGVLAMANAGPDTGGSQFFLIFGENGHNLDGNPNYTIFGRVTEGLDVAERIGALPISDPDAAAAGDLSGQQPADAVYIEAVTVASSR